MKFEELLRYANSMGINAENFVRETFQKIILYSIAKNNLYKFYIFQGGTAIRFAYGSPRFSLDLDFTIIDRDLNSLRKDADRIIKTISGYLISDNILVEKRREKAIPEENFYRYFITFNTMKYLRKKIKIKLELLIKKYNSLKTKNIIMDISYPINTSFGFRVKTVDQILCDKIASLAGGIHRKYIRWRDIFDVYWLVSKFNATIDKNYLSIEFGSWIETKDDLLSLYTYLDGIVKENNFREMKEELSLLLPRTLISEDFLREYILIVLKVLRDAMEVLK